MAPLPDNNTYRLFVIQQGTAGRHETVLRFGSAISQADAIARARAIVTAVLPLIHPTVSFIGAREQLAGSKVSFPVNWGTTLVGTSGETYADEERPQYISMTGRSPDGRRVRLTFFGFYGSMSGDYRAPTNESTAIGNFIANVRDGLPGLVTISGQVAVWNSYINLGRNAYYQRKLRRTG